ncbi:hypothetical protein MPL3365_100137 [Mesorhizobium plurifarium]|uniref:Uncharacterized protein n=1 Tax=Mesorhizobium plurifarium TaxID=69974 RepID=A0A090G0Y3_MESPL|nr:hypothetical protein MPL3365_100137 [Mesorhizobium plurifarium]
MGAVRPGGELSDYDNVFNHTGSRDVVRDRQQGRAGRLRRLRNLVSDQRRAQCRQGSGGHPAWRAGRRA